MQFQDRLYQLRKQAGLTQAELAESIQVSRQTISKWEMGNGIPDTKNIYALGKLFQVSTDYLINGKTIDERSDGNMISGSNEMAKINVENNKNRVLRWRVCLIILICIIMVGFLIGSASDSIISTLVILFTLAMVWLICYGIKILKHIWLRKNG